MATIARVPDERVSGIAPTELADLDTMLQEAEADELPAVRVHPTRRTTPGRRLSGVNKGHLHRRKRKEWCPWAESNHRHHDF